MSGMKTKFALTALIVLTFMLFISCSKKEDDAYVMTVNGKIPVSKMGITLTQEYILADFSGIDSISPKRYHPDSVMVKVIPYLDSLKQHNVATFIDGTPDFMGRDPELVREISKRTGLNIIIPTGWYSANNGKYLPHEIAEMNARQIADIWIDEFRNGIGNSGIKPGYIKLTLNDMPMSETDRKLTEGAAITHLNTGMPILSYIGYTDGVLAQLNVLKENGVDPSAFIWGHALVEPKVDHLYTATENGVWLVFDGISENYAVIDRAEQLLRHFKKVNGLSHIMVSGNAGWYQPGKPNGGDFRHYTAMFDTFLPILTLDEMTSEELGKLMINNPSEAFSIKVKPFAEKRK